MIPRDVITLNEVWEDGSRTEITNFELDNVDDPLTGIAFQLEGCTRIILVKSNIPEVFLGEERRKEMRYNKYEKRFRQMTLLGDPRSTAVIQQLWFMRQKFGEDCYERLLPLDTAIRRTELLSFDVSDLDDLISDLSSRSSTGMLSLYAKPSILRANSITYEIPKGNCIRRHSPFVSLFNVFNKCHLKIDLTYKECFFPLHVKRA